MSPRSLLSLSLLAGMLFVPRPAAAHVVLLGSSPTAGSNAVVAPTELRLIFSQRPERAFTHIALISPSGASVALDSITVGPGNVAAAPIAGPLVAGLYTVAWRTVARDGHRISGEFTFSIAPDAVGIVRIEDETGGPATDPGLRAPSPARRAADLAPFATLLRWFTLAAVIAALGAIVFPMIVATRLQRDMAPDVAAAYLPSLRGGAAIVGLWATAVALVAALLRLPVQLLATGAETTELGAVLFGTMWGRAWLIHVAGALITAVGFVEARKARSRGWLLAGVGALVLTTGLALSGHAVIVPRLAAVTVAAHAVHAIAAGGWLGTLLVIAAVALPLSFRLQREDRWRVVAQIVEAFSPVALVLAATTVAAGVVIAWLQLPAIHALWTSEYGRVLLIKVGLVVVTASVGAYNWQRVRPALGELPGARRLRRSAAAELAFAALVLAVTAVLVATPMPPP